jgi:hypothetical protein
MQCSGCSGGDDGGDECSMMIRGAARSSKSLSSFYCNTTRLSSLSHSRALFGCHSSDDHMINKHMTF